jgi:RNA recognition motif-containing protein
MGIKIFIGGFPLDMDEMGLAQLIAPHGNIEVLKIVRDKKSGIAKGYAFVEMASENDVVSVMAALDGEPLGDRQLSVKLAEAEPVKPAPRYEKLRRPGEPERKLRPRRPRS